MTSIRQQLSASEIVNLLLSDSDIRVCYQVNKTVRLSLDRCEVLDKFRSIPEDMQTSAMYFIEPGIIVF